MKVRQLEAFRAVVYTGSTTQAAVSLNISQPAVSSLIGALENEAGFPLFSRRKGRLYPTTEARYLYKEVEKTLLDFDRLKQAAKNIRELKTGQLRIACLPGLSAAFMPQIIGEFLAERPDVSVHLETCSSRKVEEWIASQQFDVGLAERPLNDPAIEANTLTMRCVCVMREDNPLRKCDRITPKHLDGLRFISLNTDHPTHFHLENAFAEAGASWNVKISTRLFHPTCALVASGAGISVVEPICAAEWQPRGIVSRPFDPAIPFQIKIMYPAYRARSRLAEALIALLTERIKPFTESQTVSHKTSASGSTRVESGTGSG